MRKIDPHRFENLDYDIPALILSAFVLSVIAVAMGVPGQLIRENNRLQEKEPQKMEMLQRQPSDSQVRPAAQ